MHKKTCLLAFLAVLLIFIAADAAFADAEPVIVGGAAVVIDGNNGQVLYEKNPHQRMYPASTTKTLTAIIALEYGRLNDQVLVTGEACDIEGSAIGLEEGERISLEDLLYALMLSSGNDAAIAIAQHIGGSVNGFVELMNKKAERIGAMDSHFNNPNGLPDPEHYSSAYDLAVIAHYAMQNPEFRKIVVTEDKIIQRENPEAQTILANHNKMLWQYEGATGIKTGYTDAAGQCLISSARRGGRELIAVVLSSIGYSIWDDSKVLLDYGFAEFMPVAVIEAAKHVTDAPVNYGTADFVPVLTGRSFIYNFPKNANPLEVRQEVKLNEQIEAPVQAGEKLGELVLFLGEKEIARVDLVSEQDVPKKVSVRWWPWLALVGFLFFFRSVSLFRRKSRRRTWANRNRRNYRYNRDYYWK